MDDNNIENSEALEKFLMDIECLDLLDKWTNTMNIFDILSVSDMEIRHSNFLAWLIDPNELHGLGDYCIKKILQNIIKKYGRYNGDEWPDIFEMDSMELHDLAVFREKENIDILAVSEDSKLVIVIENKVNSTEHGDQLEKYRKYAEKVYGSAYKKVFVYLTLDGDIPSDEKWVPYSYRFIKTLIGSILSSKGLSDRCRIYLEDYYNVLGCELMDDEKLKSVCQEIYNNHKKAIDLIMSNVPTRKTMVRDALKPIMDQYEAEGKIICIDSTNTYLRFTTPSIREKVGQVGNDLWVSSRDLIVMEVELNNDKCYIIAEIGPGDQRYRDSWYDYLSSNADLKLKRKNKAMKWTRIETRAIDKKTESDQEYVEFAQERVKEYIEDRVPKLEALIKSGPDLR